VTASDYVPTVSDAVRVTVSPVPAYRRDGGHGQEGVVQDSDAGNAA